jgi:hypothetical protein
LYHKVTLFVMVLKKLLYTVDVSVAEPEPKTAAEFWLSNLAKPAKIILKPNVVHPDDFGPDLHQVPSFE